jgi:drug/metabolite transporter (DMT)-like permease
MILFRVRLPAYKLVALVLVVIGTAVVGVSPVLFPTTVDCAHAYSPLLGSLLVLLAQLFTALHFLSEEFILRSYRQLDPIHLIGLEGIYGTLILGLGMICVAWTSVMDLSSGLEQMRSNSVISLSSVMVIVSMPPL